MKMEYSIVCIFLLISGIQSIDKAKFYLYGVERGDSSLEIGDDVISEEIYLQTEIYFYDTPYQSLFINSNGFISFEQFSNDNGVMVFPTSYKIIAPFLADIDTSMSGNIYYRETQDPSILGVAERLVRKSFNTHSTFNPQSMFIVTWDSVGHYQNQYSKVNSFQLVLVTDGLNSFAIFLYDDNGINWIDTDRKYSSSSEYTFAQVGVDSGNEKYFTLPGSGTANVAVLAKTSNVGLPGVWLMKIGNVGDGDVETPNVQNNAPKSCSAGGQAYCHANGICKDYGTGFCCECSQSFFGNGQQCIELNAPQRISGKVSGSVNGYTLDAIDLHGYAVTSEGRAYISISRVPPPIGVYLQALFSLGSVLNWLFALPTTADVHNGFMITGSSFNRTAHVEFQPGGENINIVQKFEDFDESGNMQLTSILNGNIPSSISPQSRLVISDFKEDFRRVKKGTIKSIATHEYSIDDENFSFTVDQTINFKECDAKPLDRLPSHSLTATRTYVSYGEKDEIVRFASINRIAVAGDENPCQGEELKCASNAVCVPTETSYRCICKEGFEGDGQNCYDINECSSSLHDCDQNAYCINNEGSYKCQCTTGYTGDGKACAGLGCDILQNCSPNAECIYDEDKGIYECRCLDGFSGDGIDCNENVIEGTGDVEEDVCRKCSVNAKCIHDPARLSMRCKCDRGYSGDGFKCVKEETSCLTSKNCDKNAQCLLDSVRKVYSCVCNEGYSGNGYKCEISHSCDNSCDVNAECIFDTSSRGYVCQCKKGWTGDGQTCQQTILPCDRLNNCHINAECLVDPYSGNHHCQCMTGYKGDGYSCTPIDCQHSTDHCDKNAKCEQRGQDFICVCKTGYYGDGMTCAPSGQSDSYLLFSHGKVIYELPFKPSQQNPGKRIVNAPDQTIIGLDVDCYLRYVYWTDIGSKQIFKARLDGTDQERVIESLSSPEDVAIDWLSRNMYWTDSGLDVIEVSRLDGTNRKTLINSDLENPRAVQTDPIHGYLFWTDWNRQAPKIERSYLDGTNRQIIVKENLGLPNGLVIDSVVQRLCWADAGTKHIECASYDGRIRRIIFAKALYPFDLAYAQNVFYWTDWQTKNLQNVNEFSDNVTEPILLPPGSHGKLYGLTTVPSQCPRGANACSVNNGGCRFLCLPTPNAGRTCTCPDDINEDECNRISLL